VRGFVRRAVLRSPLRDLAEGRKQLEYLLPLSVGPHGLMNATVMFLRLLDGRTVA
jgi:hypothetical protein